jgi:hypothetical protein
MRKALMLIVALAVSVTVAATGQAADAAQSKTPEGFGKAHFGMSIGEVKAVYPELTAAPNVAGYLSHTDLQRQVLWKTPIKGLAEPVDIELRFWKDRLYMFLFYTGKNPAAKVTQYLQREYGPPASGGLDPAWVWPGRMLINQSAHGWFALSDKELGKEAQSALAARRTPGAAQ